MDCSYTCTRYPELRRPQARRVDPTRPETFPPFGPDMCDQQPGCGCAAMPAAPCQTTPPCANPPGNSGRADNRPIGNSRGNNLPCGNRCAGALPCNGGCISTSLCNGGCSGALPGGRVGPGMTPGGCNNTCTNTAPGCLENFPLAMGYVPWQQWQQTYPLDTALQRGTIFPVLDLPFMMGRCQP